MCRSISKKKAVKSFTLMALETQSGGAPDVIILCGGLGTRLQPVLKDRPKSLAEMGGKTFLDILLNNVFTQGFKRVILAVGHMREQIMERYAADPRIKFSVENEPLGTGGAIKNALPLVQSEHFIVMNGDSISAVDLREFYERHLAAGPLISMAVTEVEDVSDRGSVTVDESGRVKSFREKIPVKRPGLVSAGVYILSRNILGHLPEADVFSLEEDVFPRITGEFCLAHVVRGGVLDIGTPERYEEAKKKFAAN